jgi:tripeptidyl-peptidase-1
MKIAAFLSLAATANAALLTTQELALPDTWTLAAGRVPARVNLSVSVKQNANGLKFIEQHVQRLHAEHLTGAEIRTLTAPRQDDMDTVTNFFKNACKTSVQAEVVSLDCDTTAVEALLDTKFRTIGDGQQTIHRAGAYSLPSSVQTVVQAIYGLHQLPLPRNKHVTVTPANNATQNSRQLKQLPVSVNPKVIRKAYDVSGVTPTGSAKNRQAVVEFQAQETISQSDLSEFFYLFVPNAPPNADKVSKFVGPTDGLGAAGVESSLDIQYIMGVAPGVQTEFWYMQNSAFCSDMKRFCQFVLNQEDGPNVYSISYGWQGPMSQLGCQQQDIQDVDQDFKKIAAMGVSIVVASGDSGAQCLTNSTSPSGYTLWPSWPASSQWVTAVGATRFENQDVNQPQMAVDQFGSGGGFSSMFDVFASQEGDTKAYLAKDAGDGTFPPQGSFQPQGRGTPDVAALGEGFQVVISDQIEGVGGTSASAPTFAALISLMNEKRIQNGKSGLGYLNPFLYAVAKNGSGLTDITSGTNAISRSGQSFPYGWAATSGWDAATGLGTPSFPALLSAALAKK